MMKKIIFLLGASTMAFGQSLTSEPKYTFADLALSSNVLSYGHADLLETKPFIPHSKVTNQNSDTINNPISEKEVVVTYENKKLKTASVYSEDGTLIQTSSKALLNEKKLKAGNYIVKVDFEDGTSTSAKFIKK
ncbi:MAG: T9SS type A sorting domain-containing protein [Chryseobacterium sp.]|nr:T9SS type A sorting domain-containing protein [Chryseobacterium sp.]